MILRSQLRMNKNIVFPFISCIMIMFTLLVLIHKSADELNATKKELSHMKQQHDSLYTQLQNAIELKLRLEKVLKEEKSDGKLKLEELQTKLNQEEEQHKKDKDEADSRYETLNQQCSLLKTENKDNVDNVEQLNKKILDMEEDTSKVNEQLKSVSADNERKDKIIAELKEKLKSAENSSAQGKKSTQASNNAPAPVMGSVVNAASVPNASKGPSTPQINPQAIKEEDSPKQVAPPPNGEENAIPKDSRDKLNVVQDGPEQKAPQENVVKPPQLQVDEDKKSEVVLNGGGEISAEAQVQNAQKNQPNMFLPIPLEFQAQNKPPSSASNNAAENRDALPAPVPNAANENERIKEIPKQMKDYGGAGGEYDNNVGEDDGEGEYMENNIAGNKGKKEVQRNEPV